MESHNLQTQSSYTPNHSEVMLAKESSQQLAKVLSNGHEYQLQFLSNGEPGEVLALPARAVQLLAQALAEMAVGNTVKLEPVHEELSTDQAADLLGVSQIYLEKLLTDGLLPFHQVGTHRRIRLEDINTYKEHRYAARSATLDELAAYDQELGLE